MTIKVITTVGTSLFTNFMDDEVHKTLKSNNKRDTEIDSNAFKRAKKNVANQDDLNNVIKSKIKNYWIDNIERYEDDGEVRYRSSTSINKQCCAEVQTLLYIAEKEYKDHRLEVYLLCTDTQLSKLAGEIISDDIFFLGNPYSSNVVVNLSFPVPDLQIKDAVRFEEKGFFNLVDKIREINDSSDARTILNISGGYKALIPPLTIIGQLHNLSIFYQYEDSNTIIELSPLPLQFDLGLLESYIYYLSRKKHEHRRLEPNEKLALKDLVRWNLFKKDNNDYLRTVIGEFLFNYIKFDYPASTSVLGYYMEHKFYELYIEESYLDFTQVKHSQRINEPEIDIILSSLNKEYIACEVKSFNQINFAFNVSDVNNEKNFAKQMQYQYDKAFLRGRNAPKEYHLLIYKQPFQKEKWLKKTLKKLQEEIMAPILLKVFFVTVDFKLKNRNYFQNPYQQFMSRKFTKDPVKFQNGIDQTKENKQDFELVKEYNIL